MKKATKTKSKAKTKAKAKAGKAKPKKTVSNKILLVYGYGDDARPRAAAFTEPDFKLSRKAAGLLGLSTFVAAAPELKSALKGIKPGNVYASGDGFAPKIPQKRFEGLLSSLKLAPLVPPAPAPSLPLATSWTTVDVGQLLLASHSDATLGFWECVVEKIDGDDLTLRARDFPDIQVVRHRAALALLYSPDYVPPENVAEAAPGLPTDWSIKAGHLVLANLGPREGWYPAIVSKRDGEKLTLHWQDEPTPTFTRAVTQVALLYPKSP